MGVWIYCPYTCATADSLYDLRAPVSVSALPVKQQVTTLQGVVQMLINVH